MTTIAVSDGVVAADTQLTGGNYAVRALKLVRLPDGGVATACGTWRSAYPGLMWLAGGEKGDPPDIDGATIVIVRPDHSIWVAEETWPPYPILDKTYAAGSGVDLVRAAMAQGMTPAEAVTEACKLDLCSSAPVTSMEVEQVAFSEMEVHGARRKRGK